MVLCLVGVSNVFANWWGGSSIGDYAADTLTIQQNLCEVSKSLDGQYQELTKVMKYGKVLKNPFLGRHQLEPLSEGEYALLTSLLGFDSAKISSGGCEDAGCLLEYNLGREKAFLSRYILLKYNVVTTSYAYRETQSWSLVELKLILLALENLPGHLFPLKAKISLLRQRSDKEPYGHHEAIGKTDGSGSIRFFNWWEKLNQLEKLYALTHELAHTVGVMSYLDRSSEWVEVNKQAKSVSKYGEVDYLEDFAESFSAYRYNPHFLLQRAPQKYQFMKELVFMGSEYLVKNCQHQNYYYQGASNEVSIEDGQVRSLCAFELSAFRVGRGSFENVERCFYENYQKAQVRYSPKSNKVQAYKNLFLNTFKLHQFPYFDFRSRVIDYLEKALERLNP